MSIVKIANTEFVRDMDSQAVLNTDVSGRQHFEQMRKRIKAERLNLSETRDRIRQLEVSMEELKTMIAELVALRGTNGHH